MNRAISRGFVVVAALSAILVALPTTAQQATGTITGRVLLKDTTEPLYGVEVKIEGTKFTTVTDRAGRYKLAAVPAGERALRVSSQGFAAVTGKVVVPAGGSVTFDASLEIPFQDAVSVSAPLERSQARALTVQANAPNIVNVVAADEINALPDANVAESAGRIAGVTLTVDDGEGENMSVRGLPPQLNSVTINGERIPSTDSRNRNIDFVNTSSAILQSIEVTKAITPSMDGDAIGGVVNLVTKQAPEEGILLVSAGGEYLDQREDFNSEVNATYGQRFAQEAYGIVVSGSYEDHDRSNETRGDIIWSGANLTENVLRGEVSDAKRYSLNGAFDGVIGAGVATFYVRGTWSGREQEKLRRRTRMRDIQNGINGGSRGRLQFEIRDRDRTVDVGGFSAGGSAALSDTWAMDFSASYNIGQREEPLTVSTVYRQSNVVFTTPVVNGYDVFVSPTNQDYTKATLNQVQLLDLKTEDEDIVGRVDFKHFLKGGAVIGYGLKYRTKDKTNDENTTNYTGTAPTYDKVVEPEVFHVFDDKYGVLGQYPAKDKGLQLISEYGLKGAKDYTVDTADYTADEDVFAGYLQAELTFGQKLSALVGARFEQTESDYTGKSVVFEKGVYKETVPVYGDSSYGNLLPALHMRYAFTDKTNLRFAVTTSIARPVFYDLVPRQNVNTDNDTVTRGNPNLDVTKALNFDLLFEHYFSGVGVLSAGVFYKDIKDPIVTVQSTETIDGEPWRVTQPENGDSATMKGLEIAFSKQFRELPKPFDGLGVNVNYTYSDGDVTLGTGRETRFFLQPEHTANFSISYEKGGFSGRVALKYVGDFIEEYGATESEDIYIDEHTQWDLSLSQAIGKHLSLYANVVNANDAPWRRFYGGAWRPAWYETYSWWGSFGIRYNFF